MTDTSLFGYGSTELGGASFISLGNARVMSVPRIFVVYLFVIFLLHECMTSNASLARGIATRR